MKKKFITNLFLLLALNFLIKTFWMFGIDRTVQNITGTEEYGLYFSLLSLSILLNIILDIGITNYNNRAIARNNDQLTENFSLIVPLKIILSVFYAVIVLGTGLILGYSARQFSILGVLILNQFLLSFILYLRSNLSGLHLFRTDALMSVTDRSIVIIICSILIWGDVVTGQFRIEWLVYSQTAAYIFSAVIALILILKKTKNPRLRFGVKNGLQILKRSYPFAVLILLMSFFNRFDSVFLERILPDGKSQAGIYAQSYRILDAVNMFAVLIAGMLLPIFSGMIKRKEAIGEMVKLSFSIVFIPAITLSAIAWFYNYQIIDLLYKENIAYSSEVFSILMNGFIFISSSYIFGTLLTANRSLKQLNILAACTVIINLLLNFLLIPRLQAKGAAIASVSSQAFYAVAQILAARKVLSLKINHRFLIQITVFIMAIFSISLLTTKIISNWLISLIIISACSLLFSAVLKILTPGGIYRIIRYNE